MPSLNPEPRTLSPYPLFWACMLCWLVMFVPTANALATEVVLKDGRVLRGKLGEVAGLAEIPQPPDPEGVPRAPLILLIDNDLCRTYIPKRLVKEVRQEEAGHSQEKFLIHQRTMQSGQTVRGVGPAMQVQPFDQFGRRTYTMYTARGPVNIIQGITELTPQYAKVEGISHVWDMRIATSSIPRDELHKILLKQIDPNNIEHLKKVARFYLQAERYENARQALDDLLAAFPDRKDLKEQLAPTIRAIKQLSAQQLASELKLRADAGQHDLVWNALKDFPTDEVGGEILQSAGNLLQDYETKAARRAKVIDKFDELLPKITDSYENGQLTKIRDEIAAELSFNTVDRMAAFLQNADDAQMPARDKLALAVSGWLLGSDSSIEQLPVALSMYDIRGKLREYLNDPVKLKREKILDGLKSQQGFSPALVVDLLSHMKPPVDLTKPLSPDKTGYFKLQAPGMPDKPAFTYWVQLPPEYDPYKLYPAIVTLNGAGNTAESQVDWWAGDWIKQRQESEKAENDDSPAVEKNKPANKNVAAQSPLYRNGQAARHGYIVIAPQWTEEHQKQYNYSAREHAAVLNSLRDACRRFSIDTDRVYLSGYSMGGDAAWDIGLAHPDLWAGVIPISALADRFCAFYWENAKYVPFYVILGELDGTRLTQDARDLDRYLKRGFDATAVEYEGRGHDDFHEEILRLFDWMARFRRDFFPREFTCSTMRDWDNFFWWVELDGLPPRSQIDPAHWPPPSGTRPVQIKGKIANNNINIITGTAQLTVWLSPQMIDFKQRVSISVNGQRINVKEPFLQSDLTTILEDVRTRGDRQHPFWTKIESPTGRATGK